jgi:glycine oxidase
VFQPDVVVVGGGLIGLACATAVAREGVGILVVSSTEPGAASPASAGILAPSVGDTPAPARALGIAARDAYPAYVQELAALTGIRVPLDHSGVLEIARDDAEARALRASLQGHSEWVEAHFLPDLEPSLAGAAGAAFHARDGAVDARALLSAVRADAQRDPRISLMEGRVIRIEVDRRPALLELQSGERVEADKIVIAAGAWVGRIWGLPRPVPVVPVRGQILMLEGESTRHVVMGANGYVVPRGNRCLVGSTMEHVGFDARTTAKGAKRIREIAVELSPSLSARPELEHWAGLRPVTPDFLPIVGVDPDHDALVYACGHSRNGVLLAPLTAHLIADLIVRGSTSVDASPYAAGRFEDIAR